MLTRLLRTLLSTVERGRARSAFAAMDMGAARMHLERAERNCTLDVEEAYMLGAALLEAGRFAEAETRLRSALEAQPDHFDARRMLAMRHLLAGDWPEGFRLYESSRHEAMRRTPPDQPDSNRDWLQFVDYVTKGIPRWRGEALDGKRILVWSEYGRGDAIMTLRLLQELRERHGARDVVGMSDAAEECLFRAAGIPEFVELRLDWKPAIGEFDFHCSMFSLLHLLGVSVDSIPGRVPYLNVPPERVAAWRNRLSTFPGLKIGLAWRGNPDVPFDKLRSLSLEQLTPLLSMEGFSYFSLQKDGPAREESAAVRFPLVDMMDQCHDFMDTAALIQSLDLIVSVDTAVAHLSGALGMPIWLLNRYGSEWRWLRDRERSVWYPSMRIFNQHEPRNWGPVIETIASELHVMLREREAAGETYGIS